MERKTYLISIYATAREFMKKDLCLSIFPTSAMIAIVKHHFETGHNYYSNSENVLMIYI